jgi:hypothetical protein
LGKGQFKTTVEAFFPKRAVARQKEETCIYGIGQTEKTAKENRYAEHFHGAL